MHAIESLEKEADRLFIENRGLIIKLLKLYFKSHIATAIRNGFLVTNDIADASYSYDLYISVRRSLVRWLDRGRPTAISKYIYNGLRSWAWYVTHSRLTLPIGGDGEDAPAQNDCREIDIDTVKARLPNDLLPILEATLSLLHKDQHQQAAFVGVCVSTYKMKRRQLRKAILEVAADV